MSSSTNPESPVSLSPMYQATPEALAWVDAISAEIALNGISVATARVLATNDRALIMADAIQAQVWSTLADHYGADGLQPVEATNHSASEDIRAAMTCEKFAVSVRTVTEEYGSRDWTKAVEPYKQYSYQNLRVYFSTFVGACRRIALVRELQQQRTELAEVQRPWEPGVFVAIDPRMASSAKLSVARMLEARIGALTKQLYVSGIPQGPESEPEKILVEVFGDTTTAQAFSENAVIKLPDLADTFSIDPSGRSPERRLAELYHIGRIMLPKKS